MNIIGKRIIVDGEERICFSAQDLKRMRLETEQEKDLHPAYAMSYLFIAHIFQKMEYQLKDSRAIPKQQSKQPISKKKENLHPLEQLFEDM